MKPHIIAVNRHIGVVVLSTGETVEIDECFDEYGDECSIEYAVTCTAGPMTDGSWLDVDLTAFTDAHIN